MSLVKLLKLLGLSDDTCEDCAILCSGVLETHEHPGGACLANVTPQKDNGNALFCGSEILSRHHWYYCFGIALAVNTEGAFSSWGQHACWL